MINHRLEGVVVDALQTHDQIGNPVASMQMNASGAKFGRFNWKSF